MRNLFRILATFLVCVSGTAYSWNDNQCNNFNPCCQESCESDGFYVGGMGMWAVPSETGLGTFTDSWQYLDPDGGTTALSKPSKTKYKGAWGVKAGYDTDSGNNIEASYFRLHNSKHNVNDTSDGPTSFGSVFFNLGIPLAPGAIFVSDSHLRYTLDQVDLKFGHWFTFNNGDLRLLPSIGVRYFNVEHDLTFLIGHVRSKYWGAGPMLGFDSEYQLVNGFFLTGRFDGAIIMGAVKADSLLTFGAINRYKSPSIDRITYSVDGSVGLAYKYSFQNKSSLKLELGYRVANYIGTFDIIQAFLPPTSPVPRIDTINTSNFGYSGPFLELTYHM